MAVTMEMIKELRERTGAGVVDCKKVLMETEENVEKAIEELQKRGIAKAAKKPGRIAAQGLIANYVHDGGRIAVLVEINCETDFVTRGDEFKELCDDIAMQVAAMNPSYVRAEEIPAEDLEKQKEIFSAQVKKEGKPEKIIPKIAIGTPPSDPPKIPPTEIAIIVTTEESPTTFSMIIGTKKFPSKN